MRYLSCGFISTSPPVSFHSQDHHFIYFTPLIIYDLGLTWVSVAFGIPFCTSCKEYLFRHRYSKGINRWINLRLILSIASEHEAKGRLQVSQYFATERLPLVCNPSTCFGLQIPPAPDSATNEHKQGGGNSTVSNYQTEYQIGEGCCHA